MAIASVKATTVGAGNYQNKTIPVIHGIQAKDKSPITLFPGSVPDKLPKSNYWQEHPFNFIEFLPQHSVADNEMLPHLRMDQVLQYLIGDKMR
jgi:hypothetical protein